MWRLHGERVGRVVLRRCGGIDEPLHEAVQLTDSGVEPALAPPSPHVQRRRIEHSGEVVGDLGSWTPAAQRSWTGRAQWSSTAGTACET